jgi:hypothetical protein
MPLISEKLKLVIGAKIFHLCQKRSFSTIGHTGAIATPFKAKEKNHAHTHPPRR